MSSNNPSNGWVYDYHNQKYVRWDQQKRRWVDEYGRDAQPPQATPPTAAQRPQQSTSDAPGASSSKPGRSGSTAAGAGAALAAGVGSSNISASSIENSLRQLSLAPSSTKPTAFRGTARDQNTGLETLWDITEGRQYRDFSTSESTRSLKVKRIRQQKDARSVTGWLPSKNPSRDYTPGRVIEVALVPPSTTSALSQITPTPYPSPGDGLPQGKSTRYRRFVIFRQKPDGRNSFEALAIKTYNGQGVAARGVVKAHHAIIHTSMPPPHPLAEELPTRRSDGNPEAAMQAMPIRVEQWDRATALDPRARLDYMDTYEFDYGVTNIRLWGRIHEDSQATFYSQFSNVWRMFMGGVTPTYTAPGGRDISDTASQARTITANRSMQPSAGVSNPAPGAGGPRRQPSGQTAPIARRQHPPAAAAPSFAQGGAISEQEVQNAVRRFQDYARANDLTIPGQSLTREQIRVLASNALARTQFFQRIREAWDEEMNESDDDDDDDDDDRN